MYLLKTIIEKEIRNHLLSFKFTIIFILSTFLIILSLYTGSENYHTLLTEYNNAVNITREEFDNSDEDTRRTLHWQGYTVHRPPSPLSTIVFGLEGNIGRNVSINAWRMPKLTNAKFDTNPVFTIFGSLDLLFIVKIVLSLAAILFSYDMISGENETGTLRLMSSNPVPRDTIIIGKSIGGFLSLTVPLLIPILIGVIMVVFLFKVHFTSADWIRFIGIIAVFFVYIFLYFMLGVFVSSLTRLSRVTFLYLLVVWVCFVLIIPKVGVMIAEQVTKIPPKYVVEKKFLNEGWKKFRDRIDEQKRVIDENYQKKYRNMTRLAMIFSRVSPTSSMVYATMALGRTGISEYDHFMDSLREYRGDFRQFFEELWQKQRDRERREGSESKETGGEKVDDFADFPHFRYIPTSLDITFREVLIDSALLIVFSLVFFMGAYVSFLRYPVA